MSKKAKNEQSTVSMSLVNPHAGAIDIGSMLLCVAVPPGTDVVSVKEFGAFTEDLNAIAAWFKKCGVTTVARECTGVYWRNIYSVLITQGFDVCLVNARHTRNVTGKKTDESDAQWIQRLHSCGLLNNSFLPDDVTLKLRTLTRQRRSLTQDSSRYILRMQKAMELMNIKRHSVISDVMSQTGKAVIDAIIAGERDPQKLLLCIGKTIKADRAIILKSLQGNWRDEYLFLLEQSYRLHLIMREQIALCDQQIEKALQSFDNHDQINDDVPNKIKQKNKNHPRFDTSDYLKKNTWRRCNEHSWYK